MEELLDIEPPEEEEMFHLQWDPCVLDWPLYQRDNGEIESAQVFNRRLRDLGLRAGYSRPPTIHDFRAGGLHLIGIFSLFTTSRGTFCSTDNLADKAKANLKLKTGSRPRRGGSTYTAFIRSTSAPAMASRSCVFPAVNGSLARRDGRITTKAI
jgi:hypothetical protein